MKSLQEFINQHRSEFDHRTPEEDGWDKISAALDERPSISWWNKVGVWQAAAAVFFGLSIFLLVSRSNNTVSKEEVASIQTDFRDLESFYSTQIEEKVSLISTIASGDDEYSQDIQKLDAMYQVLREQMKTQPSQKVKDALILNLLVRIDLLNQQLKKLEDSQRERSAESDV